MAENINEFNDGNFEQEVLKAGKPVLVDFWAEWCGPCRAIEPIITEIANEYGEKIKVGKVNVDHNQQVAIKYGIRSIPALLIINKGEVANQIVGSVPKIRITELLDTIV
ncbi:MAG: thioredoxin [Candidatus Neomarinimicrobiota bacterium]